MTLPVPVVLYRYNASPYSVKVDNILAIKGIEHQTVTVKAVLPRPEITQLLGVAYRRIPILAIGSDVYCDTSLIASALERRFPTSDGYGTIFPPRKGSNKSDTGMIKAFAQHYPDSVVFPLAPIHLPWEKYPASFIQDRSAFSGVPVKVQSIIASRSRSFSLLSSHLSLVEEQLRDGREWLFDTESPSLADISLHFIYSWLQTFRSVPGLFDSHKLPYTLKWLDRMQTLIEPKKKPRPKVITGEEAAKLIMSSVFEPYDVVGFDSNDAARLGMKAGDLIQIAPVDAGKNFPTSGKLVAINTEEYVIEVQGSSGQVRCHFPRLGFTAMHVPSVTSKL